MGSNLESFLADVKRAALEAVAASKPVAISAGEVVSTNPLEVLIDQKFILRAEQLLLTSAVKSHAVKISEAAGPDRTITMQQELQRGESVLLLRINGGRKYVVLDRLEVQADSTN